MNRIVIVLVLATLALTNSESNPSNVPNVYTVSSEYYVQFRRLLIHIDQYAVRDAIRFESSRALDHNEVQCDKYYECDDGIAKEKLCPDGLVFDETIRLKNKCDQPFNVDCGERTVLQPAKSNAKCPRKNGFFAPEDPRICNIFYNCIDGEAIEIKCTAGLHFDEYTGTCVWPDSAGREGCKSAAELANEDEDTFRCPEQGTKLNDAKGQIVAHPKYPHETDCQKFYVCLNGVDKRSLGCPAGQVYNDISEMCDAPENVPGCEDWYKEDSDDKPSKGK